MCKSYSVTIVTSVPWDTERVLRLEKDTYGKKYFFSWTEDLFKHAVELQKQKTNQWVGLGAAQTYGDKARQNGQSYLAI